MWKSWLACVLGAVTIAGLCGVGEGTAQAQQVCDPASFGGGEVCFYSGPLLTGHEYDISVPLGQQLLTTDGGCVDLPSGYRLGGSATDNSADTVYVFAVSCPDTKPLTRPVSVVVPRTSGNLVPGTGSGARTAIRSVRLCGPGLALDPDALTCAYLR